jgi:hypothetical protein
MMFTKLIDFSFFLVLIGFISFSSLAQEFRLKPVAEAHIKSTFEHRDAAQLWGRLGGSKAERASALLILEQMAPFVDAIGIEKVAILTHRPVNWSLKTGSGTELTTAMPAPFDARVNATKGKHPVQWIRTDSDWDHADGKWVYLRAEMDGSPGRTNVRSDFLYQRAVAANAKGFIFSLPELPGRWQAVIPVDKPYAKIDLRYPDGIRPIPSFCIDAKDAAELESSIERDESLSYDIRYAHAPAKSAQNKNDVRGEFTGYNVVGTLKGPADRHIGIVTHLDSFFDGANDNASGMAVFVGLANALAALPEERRKATFHFAAISGHHDSGQGMRAYAENHGELLEKLDAMFLIEHTDVVTGDLEGKGFPKNLNDLRAAYIGDNGWPEVEAVFVDLILETGLMKQPPRIVKGCIADLYVVCEKVQPFCLIMGPPFYHTNHDTLDKITEEGMQRSLDFHMKLFSKLDYIELNK